MRIKNQFGKSNLIVVILIFLFVSILFSKIGYAQDDIIRIDTNLVTIPTTVFDHDGRYVTNLKKEDFQIFEDGVEQEIELFESVEQPVTVFLVLDVSGSMTNYMAELTQAANAFVRQLRPEDQVTAATFADNLYVLFKPAKISNLRKGIKIQQRFGDKFTRLYDAVHDALRLMKKIRGRKAIILFSDGVGDGTFASAESNFRDAEESETLTYTVKFEDYLTNSSFGVSKKKFDKSLEKANNYMRTLAQITGGRPYQIEKITDLEKTFAQIAAELGQQYSLGYYPKELEAGKRRQIRQIKVEMRQQNLVIRARSRYVVEPKTISKQ